MAKASPHARAFTLIEILVVMGIIVLLVALALPAFNFITGNRSTEAAGNQLAAVFGIARSQAIGIQQPKGVAIYYNASSDRTVAALVELKQTPLDTWITGTAANPIQYVRGQYVTDGTDGYVCIDTHSTPAPAPVAATVALTNTAFWRKMSSIKALLGTTSTFVDLQPAGEFVALPAGVSARAVGNQVDFPSTGSPTYRYFNPAAILFDANGQIITSSVYIAQEGLLGQETDLAKNAVPLPVANAPYGRGTATVNNIGSQIGLVLYNGDQFRNTVGAAGPDVQANWLDENGTPLMINRFNGTLVRGE